MKSLTVRGSQVRVDGRNLLPSNDPRLGDAGPSILRGEKYPRQFVDLAVALKEVVGAFDQISGVYDATRDPLDALTINALAERLRAGGISRILEVGVGTGRIAVPLTARGFEMTGVDASRRMLAIARGKRLPRLVRGNAYRLPFADGTFDGALFVHVLHLLERAPAALTEAIRVGRGGALALVHPPGDRRRSGPEGGGHDPRRLVYRYLAQEGFPVPERDGGPRTRERTLLTELPPDELVVLSDQEVTEPLQRRLDMIERRASRHTLNVPPDVLRRAVVHARGEIGDRTITYRRVEALATWRRVPSSPSSPPSEDLTSRSGGA